MNRVAILTSNQKPEGSTPIILVVDDDEGVTQTFARMLRLEGYQVRTAMNAEMGLQEAETSHPDAIILDLRMPLVDGLGAEFKAEVLPVVTEADNGKIQMVKVTHA